MKAEIWEPSAEPGRPPRHLYRLSSDGLVLARQRLADRAAANAAAARRRPGVIAQARTAGGAL
ncbi:hypothetical protein [Actinoplanes sp. NPDC051859]|uniref:hypothetical protein n=1 Tax=Actinoplanes sp. NPDC051859 TaxID=3363909 RepID=UPI0037B80995